MSADLIHVALKKAYEVATRECEAQIQELQELVAHLSTGGTASAAVSMALHEVAQPVTAATNFLSVAEKLLSSADRAANSRGLDAVHFAQECLTRTCEVMATVRSASEMRDFDPSPQDLRGIVNEAIKLFEFVAMTPLVNIPVATSRVMGDRVQLGQVLANLIRNAMEATEGQTVRVLQISSQLARAGFVEIRIEDNGPGISDKIKGLLFSAFSSTKADGAGVGLSICRAIIERHGGRIRADALAQGTAFCFTLPASGIAVKLRGTTNAGAGLIATQYAYVPDAVDLTTEPAQAA